MNTSISASPINIGVQGLKQSMNDMGEHASKMQQAQIDERNEINNQDSVDITQGAEFDANIKQYNSDEQLIYTSMSALEAKANTKVIQAGSDVLGTLIDMKI